MEIELPVTLEDLYCSHTSNSLAPSLTLTPLTLTLEFQPYP